MSRRDARTRLTPTMTGRSIWRMPCSRCPIFSVEVMRPRLPSARAARIERPTIWSAPPSTVAESSLFLSRPLSGTIPKGASLWNSQNDETMATGRIDRPGIGHGPCDPVCSHLDCAALRRIAETNCTDCGEPIGYDRRFLNLRGDDLMHEDCLSPSLEEETRRALRAHDSRLFDP